MNKLILLMLLIVSSCSKEDIGKENDCACSKSSYVSRLVTYYTSSGTLAMRRENTLLSVEENIGCYPEGIVKTSTDNWYRIDCED